MRNCERVMYLRQAYRFYLTERPYFSPVRSLWYATQNMARFLCSRDWQRDVRRIEALYPAGIPHHGVNNFPSRHE
jgi:hypothetical protein